MGLSKQEWRSIEESAAAAERGKRRANYHAWRMFYRVPTLVVVAAGTLGLGCWWLKVHAIDPMLDGGGLSVPFWLILLAAVAATVAAFRLIPPYSTAAFFRTVAVVAMWLGLAGYAIAVMI